MIKRNLFITALILMLFYIIDNYIGYKNIPGTYIVSALLICIVLIIVPLLRKGKSKSYPIYIILFYLSIAVSGALTAIDSILSSSLPNYPRKGGNIIFDTALI